jgi:hypothetical protein
MLQCTKAIAGEKERTFVLKEIAHPGATGQDELSHILDNLGLLLRRESRKPFGKTHFALPRQQDQVMNCHYVLCVRMR